MTLAEEDDLTVLVEVIKVVGFRDVDGLTGAAKMGATVAGAGGDVDLTGETTGGGDWRKCLGSSSFRSLCASLARCFGDIFRSSSRG